MSYFLSWAFGYPPERYGNTCRKSHHADHVMTSAGPLFLRNHAGAILACDFFVVVTVTFRTLYVFVILEHGSRRLIHVGVTAHPAAEWTLQRLRQAISSNHKYRFLIHD